MRDEEAQITSGPSTSTIRAAAAGGSSSSSNRRIDRVLGKYKFWVLSAILILAFWSMFTGTVNLKWSAGNLNRLVSSNSASPRTHDDLDILEVEEREKIVKQMWDIYSHSTSSGMRLPKFWQQAFEAAYEDVTSDSPTIRNAAFAEIARISLRRVSAATADTDQPKEVHDLSESATANRSNTRRSK